MLNILKRNIVYKQSILSAKKQVVNGFNWVIVFSFGDITCELQAYEPFVKTQQYQVYYKNLLSSSLKDNEHFAESLGHSPFTHTNCVDVLGAHL